MASHLANIFGTEQDRVNCSFYYKIGACRHGDRCSRKHIRPPFSQTILLPNVYHNPAHNPSASYTEDQLQQDFDTTYEDLYCELAKYGNLVELHVCDNVGDHLIGNVYARYEWETEAQAAVDALNNRWYAGRPLYAELSPVTDFREACCRQNENGECNRGGFCNFMHLRLASKKLVSELKAGQRLDRRLNPPATSGGAGGWEPPSSRNRERRSASPPRERKRDEDRYDGHAETEHVALGDATLDEEEADLLEVAKTYYAMKELDRASHLLRDCKGPKARFLSIYCRYLAADRQAQDAWESKSGTREQENGAVNTDLVKLLELLKNDTEPFLLFLKGVILARMNRRPEATEALIISAKAYPWNWSCWKQLGRIIQDNDEFAGIRPHIGDHPAATLFSVTVMIDLHAHAEGALDLLDRVRATFPKSLYLQALRAQIFYHLRDFDEAEQIFEHVLAEDPYRVDEIDVYSNILYVMKKRARLSDIAHKFVKVAKDRPEVCCLVGNYHSLRSHHEPAIRYFQRAVLLDRTYLAAWTLMGHEFVELKNSQAAIEAYRRAIDVNRKDYRAWYGLGQTYEMIDMPQYALHYFQRATALRPYDIRMWQALASCYQTLQKYKDAIQCYRRALFGVDQLSREAAGLVHKLAQLYTQINDHEQAAKCHSRVVEIAIHSHPDVPVVEYAKSAMHCALWEISTGGDLAKARALLNRVSTSAAEESADAAARLRALDEAQGGDMVQN
ncbi:unnamed protein product [Rhizoctonia solani]|uniref:Anaphase-promoting complex subunit 8 n=1 Tax=Rhizoctonia solani TaxID=456999 RepID=A0A8H3D439_9AGAM|nr:unnamed protein product [Rhizoctonia solani]